VAEECSPVCACTAARAAPGADSARDLFRFANPFVRLARSENLNGQQKEG